MKLTIDIIEKSYSDLSEEERLLVDNAKNATGNSFSPYSRFAVGAALQLKNGDIITGANQENAVFGLCMCAERSAIFAAQSQQPSQPIITLAIAAKNKDGFLPSPVSPCGSCRQVIREMEARYNQPIKIILYGEDIIYIVSTIQDLLPLSFAEDSMGDR